MVDDEWLYGRLWLGQESLPWFMRSRVYMSPSESHYFMSVLASFLHLQNCNLWRGSFFISAQSFILQPWIEQKMSPTDAKKTVDVLSSSSSTFLSPFFCKWKNSQQIFFLLIFTCNNNKNNNTKITSHFFLHSSSIGKRTKKKSSQFFISCPAAGLFIKRSQCRTKIKIFQCYFTHNDGDGDGDGVRVGPSQDGQ